MAGIDSSSTTRRVARQSARARVEMVCWLLRRFARLQLRKAEQTPGLRRRLKLLDALVFHPPPLTRLDTVSFGGVPCMWVRAPGSGRDRTVLYLHGGGFAFHLPRGYRSFAARLSKALDAQVLLPDYRLAPEHRYPAPQDDALAVYRDLLVQGGLRAEQLIVAGDSAGGNLTLGLLQRLLLEGMQQPGCAIALSPVTDVSLSGASMALLAQADPILDAASLPILRAMAFPPDVGRDPVASPVHGRFDAIAPSLVMVGTREVLLDDATQYAERAQAGGAHVELEVWEDMPHVFPLLAALDESRLALQHMARFAAAHAPT